MMNYDIFMNKDGNVFIWTTNKKNQEHCKFYVVFPNQLSFTFSIQV